MVTPNHPMQGALSPTERYAVIDVFKFLAVLTACLFAGAALYINVAEPPGAHASGNAQRRPTVGRQVTNGPHGYRRRWP
jgi:hypothetical protein